MKNLLALIGTVVVLAGAQPSSHKVYVVTFDPNSTIRMAGTELSVLYETDIRPLVAAQIAEALVALPPSGISQATLDAAILAARTQFLQQSQVQWSAADTAMARLLEQQMLTRLMVELQARLAEIEGAP